MTNVLMFGGGGLLGGKLCTFLALQGFEVLKVGRGGSVDYELDITDPRAIEGLFRAKCPSYVINLVAATDVERCELDVAYAYLANTKVPLAIAAAAKSCLNLNFQIIHISTDQIYGGNGPHLEEIVSPMNVYGLSKYAGELGVTSNKTSILRTNFYGKSATLGRTSFSDWAFRSLKKGSPITIFSDVYFSAMNINSLCKIIFHVMQKRIDGTFNVGCRNSISKAEFVLEFASRLNLPINTLEVGRMVDLSFRAKRPLDMTLNIDKIESALGISMPDIYDEITLTAKEYLDV